MDLFRVTRILKIFVFSGLLFVPWQLTNAQVQCTVDLNVVPLGSVNIGDLIVSDAIENNTVYATISVATNTDINVKIEGIVEVMLPAYDDFREAGRFRTVLTPVIAPFTRFNNTQFDGDIPIEFDETNSEVLDDIRAIGKPAGGFRFTVNVIDEGGILCGSDVHEEFITNPVQILRTGPTDGSEQQEENTVFSWTADAGFSEFEAIFNERKSGQSLEDALFTNQPPIFSGSVGTATSVNLRDLPLQRQILPGMEIVWQITGVIEGVAGGSNSSSDIGWVFIADPNSALITSVINELIQLTQQLGLSELANQLLSGELSLTGEYVFADGTRVSYDELLSLLNYLSTNPDNVIDIRFE